MDNCRICEIELTNVNRQPYSTWKVCIDCRRKNSSENMRNYRNLNPDYVIRSRIQRKEYHRNPDNKYRVWAISTVSGHKYQGYKVEISREELEEIAEKTKNCFFCNKELDWNTGKGKPKENSPSLDRINNELILTKDNIVITCFKCGVTKQNRTKEEFIDYCKLIASRF